MLDNKHPDGNGETKHGFNDPSGNFPRKSVEVPTKTTEKRSSVASNDVSQHLGQTVKVPLTDGSPVYPDNNKIVTKSGHVIEYDDTSGSERIRIKHRNGSELTFTDSGDIVQKSSKSLYTVTTKDNNVIVGGVCNIIVESDANIRVQGDVNLEVDGDYNSLVYGNYNVDIRGDMSTKVRGSVHTQITKNEETEVVGNVVRRNLSHYLERTVGDHTYEIGGSLITTVEQSISTRSYGEYNGSYFGGLVTLNGEDKDGTVGQGTFNCHTIHNTNLHGTNIYCDGGIHCDGDIVVSGSVDVGDSIRVSSTVHCPSFEGTAKKAEFALGATIAGSLSTPSPTTPVPTGPNAPTDRTPEGSSSLVVVDVTGTSLPYIQNIDRSSISQYGSYFMDHGEMVARCRNKTLRNSTEWLQDHVDKGIILNSISSGGSPNARQEGSVVDNEFNVSELLIEAIPSRLQTGDAIGRSTKISDYFNVSHMLAGDNLKSPLTSSVGLSEEQTVKHMQLLGLNVLDRLFDRFDFTIAEGLYTTLPNEKIDSNSITKAMAEGRGVGIQFPSKPNSYYFQVASWIRTNMIFDELVLHYQDFDPSGVNEPVLLITINKSNRNLVRTEFNYQLQETELLDLSDGA